MGFFYSVQDVKISLERINEIHCMDDENGKQGLETAVKERNQGIELEAINFKYDPHAQKTIIDNVSLTIPKGKVTAIVGASGSGKPRSSNLCWAIILCRVDKSPLVEQI